MAKNTSVFYHQQQPNVSQNKNVKASHVNTHRSCTVQRTQSLRVLFYKCVKGVGLNRITFICSLQEESSELTLYSFILIMIIINK